MSIVALIAFCNCLGKVLDFLLTDDLNLKKKSSYVEAHSMTLFRLNCSLNLVKWLAISKHYVIIRFDCNMKMQEEAKYSKKVMVLIYT